MVIALSSYIGDVLYFIKNDLITNVTDPLALQGGRTGNSKFVLTAYPQRPTIYPVITIRLTDSPAKRTGQQTTAINMTLDLEIRIWARNQKEKDQLAQAVLTRLDAIQYTSSTGSIANQLHDFEVLGNQEINEDGDNNPKSRVMQVRYKFYT